MPIPPDDTDNESDVVCCVVVQLLLAMAAEAELASKQALFDAFLRTEMQARTPRPILTES
jgi:hypothetical protein